MSPSIRFDRLWEYVVERCPWGAESLHGPDHWRRVEATARTVAAETGADLGVVRLFGLFHDARRISEGSDPEHGARGAAWAASLRGALYQLETPRLTLLVEACTDHTGGRRHTDLTIGSCWDADRLDLGRVGMTPDPAYMSTKAGQRLAEALSRAARPASRRSR